MTLMIVSRYREAIRIAPVSLLILTIMIVSDLVSESNSEPLASTPKSTMFLNPVSFFAASSGTTISSSLKSASRTFSSKLSPTLSSMTSLTTCFFESALTICSLTEDGASFRKTSPRTMIDARTIPVIFRVFLYFFINYLTEYLFT